MTDLHTTIEAAIHRELRRPASRTMPVSALAGHLASAVLAAIRGAGYEIAREECGARMPATAPESAVSGR